MAGAIRCSMKPSLFVGKKSSLFGSFPVNTPTVVVCFPALKSAKFGVTACAASSSSSTTRKPRGIMKPRPISPALQEFVGAPEISRTQALKVIWAHIKANNLQDPNDKKIIICDEKLKKIFAGKERVGFLEISGLITPHLL
ncbi:upstream activation factor subunit UAF30-like [Amaranthus tricolor]|uniref:upstream activation factor subunit UAF30-like n=1 Tax=Amaranthus tricolor TaxID=29722 RepID=UPI00258ECD32|nr:upstream activation factor subunit UAF30-like [Amaranthus tricolor]